ncbi:hypothetical protein MG290_01675 [Flavobacterium sp. CBA20B-1]|uniref:hypothetical protein n=1 Tax=unclassified Flavobacterium TaxID=196869 RepID=UPI0022258ED6|nr:MULTISPECIES: hypothetical protein [unclassified Flavobacterium]WCM42405.1 hypothetical protein MG290_01675 [Flavobacterium sp. CBA20B-1]
MIYNTLDLLPIKTFYKIQETGNLKLLNAPNLDETELKDLFDSLSDQFNKIDKGEEFDREFLLQREISHLETKVKIITLGVEILRFEYDDEVKASIEQEAHHKIRTNRTEYYYKDLERIEKKISLINTKIQRLKEQQKTTQKSNDNSSIDDMLASICSILGVSFDFNTIPCTTYLAYKKQTQSKIKAQDEQIQKLNIR